MSAGRRLLLLRHGRTAWNAEGRVQGQLDPPLDDLGARQSRAAAAAVAALRPDVLLSSDLLRARAGAKQVSELTGLPVRSDPGLREVWVGAWQGLTRDEAHCAFPAEYAAWQRGEDIRRGGGETYAEVGARAASVILTAADELPDLGLAVAVTHGGTIRALTGVLLELPPAQWWRLAAIGNCCWTVLAEGRRGWRLIEHGVRPPGVTDVETPARVAWPPVAVAPDVEPQGEDGQPDDGMPPRTEPVGGTAVGDPSDS